MTAQLSAYKAERATRKAAGEPVEALRDMRGVAYLLGRTEALPDDQFGDGAGARHTLELPSFEDVKAEVFVRMGRSGWVFMLETDVERRIGSRAVQGKATMPIQRWRR